MSDSNVPPLSQSRESKLACPEFYASTEIDHEERAPSRFSERGTQIHRVMAKYAEHCAKRKVPADWAKFDELAAAVGAEASQILVGMRDSYVVDWEHFYQAEVTLILNPFMEPLNLICLHEPVEDQSSAFGLAYQGTLDALFVTGDVAYIPDYKSHWRPFDADTFQSKFYPFLVFKNFPTINEVTFELIFVRFKNARRSVTYRREDMPALAAEIQRARAQQLEIHESCEVRTDEDRDGNLYDYSMRDELSAIPGPHCVYCPHLARGTCPLGKANPYDSGMTIEDRVKQVLYFDQARAHHMAILKEMADTSQQSITIKDERTGKLYEAAYRSSEGGYFPLMPTLEAIVDSFEADGDCLPDVPASHLLKVIDAWLPTVQDKTLMNGLRIGSTQLKSKLKAKKRAVLDQHMKDNIIVKETSVEFGIKEVMQDGQTIPEPYQKKEDW